VGEKIKKAISVEGLRKRKNISYYWFYCERWANQWGQRFSGMKQKDIK